MNKISIGVAQREYSISTDKHYFYYKNPFDGLIGDGKVFKESEDGGLVLNNCSFKLSEQGRKIISAVSDFYKCLHKKHEIVNQDNLCYINKDLFEKFKPLQSFVFRDRAKNINSVDSKIDCGKKNDDSASVLNLDSVFDSFFRKLRLLRCFYNTMDILAPKDFTAKNVSVNELLINNHDIFKFKIIIPKNNELKANGNISFVSKTDFNGKNYFYKKLSVCEKVPNISKNKKENDKNLNDQEKQNLSMGNYLGAKEGDLVIIDPVFRQLGQSIIAEHFGFDNIIPTEIGFLKEGDDFEPVCLMEEAKGKIGYQILIYLDEDEKNEALFDIKHNNLDAEIVNANNPDLQIKSLELGIIDFIGLNPDRHAGNIFLYKTKDGNFKLTGIDNDWCFLIDPPGERFNLGNFFESKLPFITSNLKNKVLSGLSDDKIKKLLAKLEGKINRALGGKAVIKAVEDRLRYLKKYIEKCDVIDELNGKTAQEFIKQFDVTKDNPISAMRYRVQSFCHPDKFIKLKEISNKFITNDLIKEEKLSVANKPKDTAKIKEKDQNQSIKDKNQDAQYNISNANKQITAQNINANENADSSKENKDIKKENNLITIVDNIGNGNKLNQNKSVGNKQQEELGMESGNKSQENNDQQKKIGGSSYGKRNENSKRLPTVIYIILAIVFIPTVIFSVIFIYLAIQSCESNCESEEEALQNLANNVEYNENKNADEQISEISELNKNNSKKKDKITLEKMSEERNE